MTNKVALILAFILVAVFAVDWVIFGGAMSLFLGKKILVLITWIAFWR